MPDPLLAEELFPDMEALRAEQCLRLSRILMRSWSEGDCGLSVDQLDPALTDALAQRRLQPWFGTGGQLGTLVGEHLYSRRTVDLWSGIRNMLNRGVDEKLAGDLPLQGLGSDQAKALELAGSVRVLLVTGGPGTGKSTLAGSILELWDRSGIRGSRVALTAPTGRAVGRLAEAAESDRGYRIGTLHSLLGRRLGSVLDRTRPIDVDAILVDEVSMIGLDLFHELLSALSESTRIVLLGDPDQLEPVEPGPVLSSLCRPGVSAAVRRVHLATTYRQDSADEAGRSLIDLAGAIRESRFDHALVGVGAVRHEADRERALERFISEFAGPMTRLSDPAEMIGWNRTGRLLAFHNEGLYGVGDLNDRIAASMGLDRREGPSHGEPVLVLQNDPGRQLSNGDLGVCVHGVDGPMVWFEAAGTVRSVPWAAIRRISTSAWAISVHKSQGSEFDRVTFMIPAEGSHLERALVYTAVTRARIGLVFAGSLDLLTQALESSGSRGPGLPDILPEQQGG